MLDTGSWSTLPEVRCLSESEGDRHRRMWREKRGGVYIVFWVVDKTNYKCSCTMKLE